MLHQIAAPVSALLVPVRLVHGQILLSCCHETTLLRSIQAFSGETALGQEISTLALHLLQNSLIYINTHMLQQVLTAPRWYERMTEADWRGLTPLFYEHVNPYGSFNLDLKTRLPLEVA